MIPYHAIAYSQAYCKAVPPCYELTMILCSPHLLFQGRYEDGLLVVRYNELHMISKTSCKDNYMLAEPDAQLCCRHELLTLLLGLLRPIRDT